MIVDDFNKELLTEVLELGRVMRNPLMVENVQLLLFSLFDVVPVLGGCETCGGLLAFCSNRDNKPVCRRPEMANNGSHKQVEDK